MNTEPPSPAGSRRAVVRRRPLLAASGVVIVALLLVLELLLLRSYDEIQRTTRDFSETTGTTTAIANIQRETLLLDMHVSRLPTGPRRRAAVTKVHLRRGLLARQLDVVEGSASSRASLRRRVSSIRATLAEFDRALGAIEAGHPPAREARARKDVQRSLQILARQVKETFDEEEHALYAALGHTLNEHRMSQRAVVGLSAIALLLAAALGAAIWRAVRGDFARAYAALAAEAAERELLQEELSHKATHDPLTGLGNRAKFQQELMASRLPNGGRLAVLYMDLDGFKSVNDRLGHDAGDALLSEVAHRLEQAVRPCDRIARLGGDEFAVLLNGVRGRTEASVVAERLRAAVTAPWRFGGRTIRVGASVGMVLSDPAASDPDDLIASADQAMYVAKRSAKDSVCVYSNRMRADAAESVQLETELRAAIELGQLELHYQPIVDLGTEALLGLEALIRWRHPRRGLVSPADFLPIAEESGLILPIGRWVLQQACRDASAWDQVTSEQGAPWVSVNVAPQQIEDPSLVADVSYALTEAGLDPNRLLLEISERTALASARNPGAVLSELQGLGVRIALDDFGTGYTSLSSLRFLAVNVLKLDKSFIDDIATDPARQRIAAAILDLAHTLGLETVAEGVEEPAQLSALHELRCRMGQGFHFSRPVPVEHVRALVDRAARRHPLASTGATGTAGFAGLPGT